MMNQNMPPNHAGHQQGQQVVVQMPQGKQGWSSGLFGCFSDCGSCCLTCFCPCVQYGKNYEANFGNGCCSQGCIYMLLSGCGLCCCVHKGLREDIRRKYALDEGCGDCLTTCFCSACAICQEARELKARGRR